MKGIDEVSMSKLLNLGGRQRWFGKLFYFYIYLCTPMFEILMFYVYLYIYI